MNKKTLIIIITAVLAVVLAAVAVFFITQKTADKGDGNSSGNSSITSSNQVIEGGTVEIGQVETTADNEFKIEVKIAENPGIAGYDFEFAFDNKAFSFVKCENNLIAPLNATETADGILAVIGVENGDVKDNGTLFTLVFKTNKDAVAGEYELKTTKAEFANWDEITVKSQISAGKITVK